MRIPLEVTFRHMEPSAAAEARIAEKVAKLEQFYSDLTRCHVTVEAPHEHHRKGKLFHVSVDLTLPGAELLVTRGHNHQSHAHEDVYVAIRDAFDAAKRRLDDYARQQRGDVKHHEHPEVRLDAPGEVLLDEAVLE
ncbi:MAG: HPF/RaiA family ribosome-associated protein [Pseudomonadota bacterium]|nr:HPF/RaiA family ribosome-associated protein [Pseudomonadota bacterium]